MAARSRPANKRNKPKVASAQWSIASAKPRLSELVEHSQSGVQTLTRNGKPVAVVVGYEEWNRRAARKGTLLDFFKTSPLWGADLDMGRDPWPSREVEL